MAEVDRTKLKDLRTQKDKGREPDQSIALLPDRNEELVTDKDIRFTCMELYSDIEKAFDDQARRVNESMDNWDAYHCRLTPKQFYNGNSKIFVPLIHDAVNARVVRFTNQIFPKQGRHVEVTTEDGDLPHELMALLDYYISRSKLRTEVVPALLRAGDCEGQYTVYVDWRKTKRHVVFKASQDMMVGETQSPVFKAEDIQEETISSEGPVVEVISDAEFVLTPATANNIEEALEYGGAITIVRRWSKSKIQTLIADGLIDKKRGKQLLKEMSSANENSAGRKDTAKKMVDSAGIKKDSRGTYALVYETWLNLSLPEGKRLCRVYFAGRELILSVRRNPNWADRVPLISCPLRKVNGSFKGDAPVSATLDFQIQANDACNQGMDSASYALCPIVMTDPEKNPRTSSMIMSLSAIWETSPDDTQFAQFPALWKDALEIVSASRQQIIQTLGINPASITQASGKKKLNQAEVAQEQQIDLLVTADAVTVLEEGILTPILERMIELDHQYRDEEITVREFGEMGQRARLSRIKPIEMHKRWQFRWFGVEQARSAQQVQQQISLLNVIRGIPPQFYPGYKVNLVPAMLQAIENTFGPRLAPQVFVDMRGQMSEDPQKENKLLMEGVRLPPHLMDNHQMHMQVHAMALQQGDRYGEIRRHMMEHQLLLSQQQQEMLAAQQPPQAGGGPEGGKKGPQQGQGRSGGGAPPGAPGSQQGGGQRPAQQPPGNIHIDRMIGTQAPRR